MSALSPRTSSSSSGDMVHLAKDIGTLKILENTKLGQIKYDTSWDKKPHSFFKLVSQVQQQSDLQKTLVLERALQITLKNQASISHKESPAESMSAADSSCSSSTVNEFYNNDYYESGSTSACETPTPLPSPGERRELHSVSIAGSSTPISNRRSVGLSPQGNISFRHKLMTKDDQDLKDVLDVSMMTNPGLSPEMCIPLVGHVLKRGFGCREEEHNDAETLQGFLQDSGVCIKVKEALAACNQEYGNKGEIRIIQRARELDDGRAKSKRLSSEMLEERRRSAEIRELQKKQKILRTIEENRKKFEAFKAKQQQEREREQQEKAKAAKKIAEDNKRREEEAAISRAAAAKAEQERLDVERKLKEAEEQNKQKAAEIALKIKTEEELKTRALEQRAAAEAASRSKLGGGGKGYEVPPEFEGYILPVDLQRYLKSQQLLSDKKEQFSNISATTTKDFYASALKVVNTTLNSISNSPAHIQTKVDQLTKLLKGDAVYLGDSSGTNFVATALPQGILFVANLLAFRYVKKSESEISKGHTSVEPLAILGVSLLKQFPDWAVLVRANFYKMCPFLVPFSFPRHDMSVEEYAFAMGHDLKGSESAVRQALLDKMTGFCTLYTLMVRIIDRQKLTGFGETAQFFSMAEVWRILMTSMKLKPQLDMTATVIQIILDSLGDRLAAVYGHQFRKLIQYLLTSYLPEIRKETPAGKTAALTRLEIFLENKLQRGF